MVDCKKTCSSFSIPVSEVQYFVTFYTNKNIVKLKLTQIH